MFYLTEIKILNDKDLWSPEERVRESLNYQVVKSNELILKSRDDLNSRQYRIILNLISRQNPKDCELKPVTFDIEELAVYLGVDTSSRTNINRLYDEIREITTKKFWLYKTEHKMTTASWVKDAEVDRLNQTVELTLDDKLTDYLLGLQGQFTTFQLLFMSLITNKHYMILYEILNSKLMYSKERTCDITISDLRERMLDKDEKDSKYQTTTGKFTQLIDRALIEINLKTNLKCHVSRIKKGRSITHLRFNIKEKTIKEKEVLKESYFQLGNRKFVSETNEHGYSEKIYQEYKEAIDERVNKEMNKIKKVKDSKKKDFDLDNKDKEALDEIFPEKESDDVPGDMIADAEKVKKQNPQLSRGTGLPVINWLDEKDPFNKNK